jgi:hypothetical protein
LITLFIFTGVPDNFRDAFFYALFRHMATGQGLRPCSPPRKISVAGEAGI